MYYSEHSFREKWKSYILTKDKNDVTEWYIRWSSKLTGLKWMSTHVLIPSMCVVILFHTLKTFKLTYIFCVSLNMQQVIGFTWRVNLVRFIQAIPAGCYSSIAMLLACKIPKYKDYFGVREELLFLSNCGLSCVITYIVSYAILPIWMDLFTESVIFCAFAFSWMSCIMLRSTWWVLRKYYYVIDGYVTKHNIKILGLYIDSNSMHLAASSSPRASVDLSILLKDIKGFELFMGHLFSEFASENLLCYLELCQYRDNIKKKCEVNTVEINDPHHNRFSINANLPQSFIVFDDSLSDQQKVRSLIIKYIKTSAQYEVNLPYTMRMKFMHLLTNIDRQTDNLDAISLSDLLFIFDDVLSELLRLMRGSYTRFATTDAYKNYIEHAKLPSP
ncbi:hypothetical protein RFI_30174 [Reticulomyxa filosa]|uniref:RGS domain-containing protein n=1 Tax=Reticulomyxa filosa TaxID=46433 RepID=X6LZ54_RETFI|nr:hypothetical protein RFI_30174 [Reticulomyxa filosa]|eukprot:ETO07218.1 hypothetical protein RFI_30174 [Reticulomyxa filosa]